jgi:hypothetical protein
MLKWAVGVFAIFGDVLKLLVNSTFTTLLATSVLSLGGNSLMWSFAKVYGATHLLTAIFNRGVVVEK